MPRPAPLLPLLLLLPVGAVLVAAGVAVAAVAAAPVSGLVLAGGGCGG